MRIKTYISRYFRFYRKFIRQPLGAGVFELSVLKGKTTGQRLCGKRAELGPNPNPLELGS